MLFSLEALHAKQGDSLLLHFGEVDEPRLIVIDGGPFGVYKSALKPRLEALREERGGTLPIDLLMISHIDEDHINGILDFSQALIDEPDLRGDYPVSTLWHNAFEDVIAGAAGADGAGGVAEVAEAEAVPAGFEAVIASVNESRRLRDNARGLDWDENAGFDGFVMAPDDGGAIVDLDLEPLRLTVVGPRQAELDELRKRWDKELKKLKREGKLDVADIDPDQSPTNLSSIACVAELDGKRMLLTGDALGAKVLEGLESAGLLAPGDGKMELDLLKVPHHGSARNASVEFFERLPASHLVISANGKDENPDVETLRMISEARPDDEFTLHLTESKFEEGVGPKIERFFEGERKAGRKYKVAFCPPAEPSLRIDLLDAPA
jgi:hypothetical protein